jgi:hypothetical protein
LLAAHEVWEKHLQLKAVLRCAFEAGFPGT